MTALAAKYQREWYARNKLRLLGQRKARHLRVRYGVSVVWYLAQLVAQDHRCAVCRTRSETTLAVDHDHVTGKARALLCERCNWIVGASTERLPVLEAAIRYIKEHDERRS